jgi:hypothetical protein
VEGFTNSSAKYSKAAERGTNSKVILDKESFFLAITGSLAAGKGGGGCRIPFTQNLLKLICLMEHYTVQ